MFKHHKVIEMLYKSIPQNQVNLINTIHQDEIILCLIKILNKTPKHLFLFDTLEEQKNFYKLLLKNDKFEQEEILNFYSWNKLYNKQFEDEEFPDVSIYKINQKQLERIDKSKVILMTIEKFQNPELQSKFKKSKIIYIGNKLMNKTKHYLLTDKNTNNSYFNEINEIHNTLMEKLYAETKTPSIKTLNLNDNEYNNFISNAFENLKKELNNIVINVDISNENNILELYELFLEQIKNKEIKGYNQTTIFSHYNFFKNFLLTKKIIYNNDKLYSIELKNINSLAKVFNEEKNFLIIISSYLNQNMLKALFDHYYYNSLNFDFYDFENNYLFFNPKYKNSPTSSYGKTSTFWIDKSGGLSDFKQQLIEPLLTEFKINLITFQDNINEFDKYKDNKKFRIDFFNSSSIRELPNADIYLIIGNVNLNKFDYEEYSYLTGVKYNEIKNWFILMKNYELLSQLKLVKENKILILYGFFLNKIPNYSLEPYIFENYLSFSQMTKLILKIKKPYPIDEYNKTENRYEIKKKIKKKYSNQDLTENEFKSKVKIETEKVLSNLYEHNLFDSLNYWNIHKDEFNDKDSFYNILKEYLRPYFKSEFNITKKNFSLNDLNLNNHYVTIRKYGFLKSLKNKQKRRD